MTGSILAEGSKLLVAGGAFWTAAARFIAAMAAASAGRTRTLGMNTVLAAGMADSVPTGGKELVKTCRKKVEGKQCHKIVSAIPECAYTRIFFRHFRKWQTNFFSLTQHITDLNTISPLNDLTLFFGLAHGCYQ